MIRRSLLVLPALVLLGACVANEPPRTSYTGYNGYSGYGGSGVTESAGYYTGGGYGGGAYYGRGGIAGDGTYRAYDPYPATRGFSGTGRTYYGRSPYARPMRDGYYIYPENPPGP